MSTMVVTGAQFNTALEEINESYAKHTDKINRCFTRITELEEKIAALEAKTMTAAEKKAAKEAEAAAKEAAEAELAKLDDIANR